MYNIQRCYMVQIVLAGVSENAFSLTLDPADTLTRSMQILYSPGAKQKFDGRFSGEVPQK